MAFAGPRDPGASSPAPDDSLPAAEMTPQRSSEKRRPNTPSKSGPQPQPRARKRLLLKPDSEQGKMLSQVLTWVILNLIKDGIKFSLEVVFVLLSRIRLGIRQRDLLLPSFITWQEQGSACHSCETQWVSIIFVSWSLLIFFISLGKASAFSLGSSGDEEKTTDTKATREFRENLQKVRRKDVFFLKLQLLFFLTKQLQQYKKIQS